MDPVTDTVGYTHLPWYQALGMREEAHRANRRAGALALAVVGAVGCSPERAIEPPSEAAAHLERETTTVRGRAPKATNGVRSVVVLDPGTKVPTEVDALIPEPAFMDQYGLAFLPPVLLVREGQRIEFHNSEDVLHNVRVSEDDTGTLLFNVATPPAFGSYEHTFDSAGVFQVSCGIHAGMAATIVVVSAPFAVVADDDGSFSFGEVPPGSYRLSVWTSRSGLIDGKLVEISDHEPELILDELE